MFVQEGRVNPAPVLSVFRLSRRIIPTDTVSALEDLGVPEHLIEDICHEHALARKALARRELKILYSVIPRFTAWLTLKSFKDFNSELAQWHAFVQHMDDLEHELDMYRRPRAPGLKTKLDAYRDKLRHS